MSTLVEWPANKQHTFVCYERFYATWYELDLMVAPFQIRFTEDVAFSNVFNYFINCGNRVSLTNDCFVGSPTTILSFALRHNWYDVSSVVTTRLDQSHLQLNRRSSAKCLTWEHFVHVFSCWVLIGHLWQNEPFVHVCNTHYLSVHWNFHCSSWAGCQGLDWLAQWIDMFFLFASWPLHNSVPVLTKFKTESLNFLQNFTSQLFRPTVWDIWSRIWASNNWHCWHCWAFCFSRIANLSIVSLSPWTISLNKCRLCGILIWDSFLVIILRSASVGQNVISTDTASRWTRVESQLDTTKVL